MAMRDHDFQTNYEHRTQIMTWLVSLFSHLSLFSLCCIPWSSITGISAFKWRCVVSQLTWTNMITTDLEVRFELLNVCGWILCTRYTCKPLFCKIQCYPLMIFKTRIAVTSVDSGHSNFNNRTRRFKIACVQVSLSFLISRLTDFRNVWSVVKI